jgi:Flp pilus assembly pilin Flp
MATGEERSKRGGQRIAFGVIAALIALAVGAYFWIGVPCSIW